MEVTFVGSFSVGINSLFWVVGFGSCGGGFLGFWVDMGVAGVFGGGFLLC